MFAAAGCPDCSPLATFLLSALCLSSTLCFSSAVRSSASVLAEQEAEGPYNMIFDYHVQHAKIYVDYLSLDPLIHSSTQNKYYVLSNQHVRQSVLTNLN